MSKRVLCKFFAHGACLKGEHCEYSHDWKAPPNNICTFFQKGICAYGNRCRYDHIKVSRLDSSTTATCREQPIPDGPIYPSTSPACDVNLADRPICSFAAAGECPHGAGCRHVHGDLCPTCKKHCLHPMRAREREEHVRICERRQKQVDALKHSQEIECSVCLESILSKPTVAERKFGILSECDHPFCVSCIRNWRASSPDAHSALRSCPMCRKLSYFVIPSVVWYSSKEEKQEIVDSYKAKLRSIDCKHFDFGSGACPFGTSCFYKHAYRDGRLEEVVLHHLGAEDGDTVIAKDIRLSEFLSNLRL